MSATGAQLLRKQLDTMSDDAVLGTLAAAAAVAVRRSLFTRDELPHLAALRSGTDAALRRVRDDAARAPKPADDVELELGL